GLADALCHYLEERKLTCSMAPSDVQSGADYAGNIIKCIQSSCVMVVILSEHSNHSNHIHAEVESAFNSNMEILPFRIHHTIPEQSLDYFLSPYRWINALDRPAEDYFEDVFRHCLALLYNQPVDSPKPIPSSYDIPKHIPPIYYDIPKPIPSISYGKQKPLPVTYLVPPIKKAAGSSSNNTLADVIPAAVIAILLLAFFLIKPLFDKNTIEFKNNTSTPVYLELDGKTDTVKSLASFSFKGRKNSRVKAKARAYWTTTAGDLLGRKIEWNIDTIVHSKDNYTYPLNVASDYFFLKITNNGSADVNYVYVNNFYTDSKDQLKIKIPNDGKVYYLGYYKILPHTSIQVWDTNNYSLTWTNGRNLTFYNRYNQEVTVPYK
ncbi:MAG: toll/interleukin receptor protein, partial [Mucilaginibacter sp.]|nr:toll/interleukin receptor protein [Mucilaginibacter sp.]